MTKKNNDKICGTCATFKDGKCLTKRTETGFFDGADCETHTPRDPKTKRCSRCGRELPVEKFGRHWRTEDGLKKICNDCQSALIKEGGPQKDKKRKADANGDPAKDEEARHAETPASAEAPAEIIPGNETREEYPAPVMDLSGYTDEELYQELKKRGWNGPLEKTIILRLGA